MIKKTLKINGVERILILDKDETLAQVLRDHLLLTGCKIGCGEGHCGACNVIMNGKVTRSCIYKMSRVPDHAGCMDGIWMRTVRFLFTGIYYFSKSASGQ